MCKATRLTLLALSANSAAFIAVCADVGTDTVKKAVRKAKRNKRRE